MPHVNARLTFHARSLLITRVLVDRRPVSHVARELGVSRQCAHRWVRRYQQEGYDGLRDRSSRPRLMPRKTAPALEQRVLALRAELRQGQDRLAPLAGVPARTINAILRRHGVPRLSQCDPLTGVLIRTSKTTAVRYERDRPGELVHMDVKKLGRIPDGGGWRALGRDVADKHRGTRIGFDYVHSLVDDHSRFAYSEALPDEKGSTCAAFLERALAYFADHGITRVERLITDNAWAYRYSLREVCTRHGIRQKFIKPHCPWQNGKVCEDLSWCCAGLSLTPAKV